MATDNPSSLREALKPRWTLGRVNELIIKIVLGICAILSIFTTLSIVVILLNEAVIGVGGEAFFSKRSIWTFFFTTEWSPLIDKSKYGVWSLVCGTMMVAVIAACISIPLGLLSAIYLSEYASPKMRSFLKPSLEILAGIPTVVYGYFALVFITQCILKPILGESVDIFNGLSAGIVVGVMIIPMISSLSEDVLRSVPRGLREAGYALGATKFDVATKVVVPAALSGILASFILAISRAVGETMAVTIAAGATPRFTANPLESIQTMTGFIARTTTSDVEHGSAELQSIYAVALVLFVITLAMNMVSQWILNRYREVYQ